MMDVDSNASVEDRTRRATSVLSMDDIEAAQALEGLRSDYGQSPRPPPSSQQVSSAAAAPRETQQPEPLLSLLTSAHPLISSAINGSMSAYASSKSYSPRFKSGAEFLERKIGSPVVNTVGTVGRKTGVESGIRWMLERREAADAARNKRRKVSGENNPDPMDVEKGLADPAQSQPVRRSSDLSSTESLPPYDDNRSPSYEEISGDSVVTSRTTTRTASTWQSRLMISTSGLGVAMSEESLRSLKYCLTWLRWANGRLTNAIVALQNMLKEWGSANQQQAVDASAAGGTGCALSRAQLSQRFQAIKEDVLSTLRQVVDIVSKYAGGALPENARNLVRRHLTSLPQRFHIASASNPPPTPSSNPSDTATSAHRILVLAQEGLDMMTQVTRVVNDTLVSAEMWCERLGRKRSPAARGADGGQQPQQQNAPESGDVKRPISTESGQQDVQMAGTEEKS